MIECLVQAAEHTKRYPDVVVEVRNAFVGDDRLTNQVDGDIVTADLVSDDAQKMQTAGMLWINREDVAIDAFGFGKSSGLVQRDRLLKVLV